MQLPNRLGSNLVIIVMNQPLLEGVAASNFDGIANNVHFISKDEREGNVIVSVPATKKEFESAVACMPGKQPTVVSAPSSSSQLPDWLAAEYQETIDSDDRKPAALPKKKKSSKRPVKVPDWLSNVSSHIGKPPVIYLQPENESDDNDDDAE